MAMPLTHWEISDMAHKLRLDARSLTKASVTPNTKDRKLIDSSAVGRSHLSSSCVHLKCLLDFVRYCIVKLKMINK